MKTIAQEIAELRGMTVPPLVKRYRRLWGREPKVKNRTWLWKRCAWKVQEQRLGGLSKVAKRRLEELIAEIDLPIGERQSTVTGALRGRVRAEDHKAGTVFARVWKGREVRTVAVEGGYEWDGVVYRSLSAVAKAVTSSHWNGRLFFGLTNRRRSKSR